MGNKIKSSCKDCKKHGKKAKKCKYVKGICCIDKKFVQYTNTMSPKFDEIYDSIRTKGDDIDYYNAYQHCIKYHSADLNKLNKLISPCSLDSCYILSRRYQSSRNSLKYYVNNYRERKMDYSQMSLIQQIDAMHDWLCHNPNDTLYKQRKSKLLSNTYYNSLKERYIDLNNQMDEFKYKNIDINHDHDHDVDVDIMSIDSNSNSTTNNHKEYQTRGLRYSYDNKRDKLYCGCKYKDLKSEVMEENILTIKKWDGLMTKATKLSKTDCIKTIKHRNNSHKSISAIRIHVISMYTSFDTFCQKFNEISRLSNIRKISVIQAKKIHSTFGHSFKLLRDTIEFYGSLSNGNLEVYRGISIMPLFRKYLIQCHTPCSTSTSLHAALNFCVYNNGCVLQLNAPQNSIYFDVQFITAYPGESELLFYSPQSYLEVQSLINRFDNTANTWLHPMILLEQLTSPFCKYSSKYTLQQELKYFNQLKNLLTKSKSNINKPTKNGSMISINEEIEYYTSNKRNVYLSCCKLMRIIAGDNINDKRIYIQKLIEIFPNMRYLTIAKPYEIDINYINEFTKKDVTDCKLRVIEYYYKSGYNIKNIYKQVLSNWPINCQWEPFLNKTNIKWKKDVVSHINTKQMI